MTIPKNISAEELVKVMEVEAQKILLRSQYARNKESDAFKAGFKSCQSILLQEIERLKEFNEGAEKINREGIALISNLEDNMHTLKEENKRLRDALELINKTSCDMDNNDIAREALAPKENDLK